MASLDVVPERSPLQDAPESPSADGPSRDPASPARGLDPSPAPEHRWAGDSPAGPASPEKVLAQAQALVGSPGTVDGFEALIARASGVPSEIEAATSGAQRPPVTLAGGLPQLVDTDNIARGIQESLKAGLIGPRELYELAETFGSWGDPALTQRVFSKLTPGEVEAFGESIGAVSYGMPIGSVDVGRQLLTTFAGDLRGPDLLALGRGLTGDSVTPQAGVEFGEIVGLHTSADVKQSLVVSGASRLDGDPALAPVLGGALAGMQGTMAFSETVNRIGVGALTDVLRGSVVSYLDYEKGVTTSTWAASQIADNLRSYRDYETPPAGLTEAQEQAFRREQTVQVQAEAVLTLGEVAQRVTTDLGDRGEEAAGRLLDGATRLFERDPATMAAQIEQQLDPEGRRLTALVDGLLDAGRQEAVGRLYGRVVTDNGRSSSADYMGDVQPPRPWLDEDRGQYANARAAGHLHGAIQAALRNSADEFAGQQQLTKNVIQTAAGIASVGGAYAGVAGAIVSGLTDEVTARIASEQSRGTYDTLDEIVSEAVAPRVPNRDSDGDGVNDRATGDWITSYDASRGTVLDSRPH